MKISFYTGILLFLAIHLFAQEQQIIEQRFAITENKKIDLNLKFGTDININTWDKSEALFKAIILYSEPGVEKVHTIEIDEQSDYLSISTDYDFKAHKPSSINCFGSDQYTHYHNKTKYCIKVSYELTLPKDADVRIETICGNIEVDNFLGKLTAKSISGFIDVAVAEAHASRLKFRSVTGEIYTDFDVKLDKNSTSYAKKLNSEINNGGDGLLSLETISGDIYFRKK